MILFRYQKTGSAAYLPHLDILRLFGRVVRRAGIAVAYSEGFHPHQKWKFSSPMSLGIPSEAEYGTADCDIDPEKFREAFNRFSVPGLQVVRAARAERDPNFARILCAADYEAIWPELRGREEAFAALVSDPAFAVRYENGTVRPAAERTLEVRQESGGRVIFRLKTGADNLKPDAWTHAVAERLGIREPDGILRTAQYFQGECGGLRNADRLLDAPEHAETDL